MSRFERQFERTEATVKLQLEGGVKGETRNLSPGGLFFVTDEEMEPGQTLHFTLEFDDPAGKLHLDCIGEIVRVERTDGKIGIGAKIIESRLERRTVGLRQGAHV